MFNEYSRMDKKGRRFFRSMAHSINGKSNRRFTSEDIKRLFFDHPELRLTSNPADIALAQMLMVDAEDSDLQDKFGLIVDNRNMEFIGSGDVFWGNYPPKGGIIYPADFMALGDMPHTWVGAELINTIRDMLVYEDRGRLVLAAGVYDKWLDKGVAVSNLQTWWGPISYTLKRNENGQTILKLKCSQQPPNGFVVPDGVKLMLQ